MNIAARPKRRAGKCQPTRSQSTAASQDRAAALRRLCVQKGLPLGELARRARISRTTLHHLANGATARPHAATLARIADVLGVDPQELDGAGGGLGSGIGKRGIESDELVSDAPMSSSASSLESAPPSDRTTNTLVGGAYRDEMRMFAAWSPDDWEELYSSFGTTGSAGVRECVRPRCESTQNEP